MNTFHWQCIVVGLLMIADVSSLGRQGTDSSVTLDPEVAAILESNQRTFESIRSAEVTLGKRTGKRTVSGTFFLRGDRWANHDSPLPPSRGRLGHIRNFAAFVFFVVERQQWWANGPPYSIADHEAQERVGFFPAWAHSRR
jgi:hypothetical protein